ncbi:SpsE Sialic acid synthase [Burkholderiaceae bacterium]
MIINNREIGVNKEPYVIAELSANHNGSIERAKLSIRAAKECGVDAIKVQTYNADTMTIDCENSDFIVKGGLWDGYKLYDLYKQAHTPYEWHHELFKYARELGVTLFSTPFDETAVDLLEDLNTPAYKIASFELTDLPLIGYIAKKGKPILMSTGMSSEEEISEALETVRINGCPSVLLFHCISSYPTPIEEANLRQILKLREVFGVMVGLSDHTLENTAAITAVGLGACAIEKHFTLSREDGGIDNAFSIEPNQLIRLVTDVKDAWKALGKEGFMRSTNESSSKIFRRSLYFVNDIKSGDKIRPEDIRRIRPGLGLPPKYFHSIIGGTVTRNVKRGDPVLWDVIDIK